MPFRPFDNQNCSVARASEIFSERWIMLILREVSLGRNRFSEIKRNTGVASNILSDRLELLVEHGILVRVDEEVDGQKVDRYVLTKKGADARPILLALNDWGNKYAAPNGAPRELFHEECGHVVSPKLVCDHCSGELKASNTVMRPGPGANKHQQSIGDVRPARRGDAA
jgi:DNA-binding HxlR family transcriptional regulator